MLARLPLATLLLTVPLTSAQEAELTEEVVAVEAALRKHPYMTRLKWKLAHRPPSLLLVQDPHRAGQDFVPQQLERWAAWIQDLGRRLDSEYLTPAGVTRPTPSLPYSLFVLENQRGFANIRRDARGATPHPGAAVTLDDPHIVVTFAPGFAPGRSAAQHRRPVLETFVRDVIARYGAEDVEVMRVQPWFTDGLARYLSWHTGDSAEELATAPVHQPSREWLEALGHEQEEWDAWLLPLRELMTIHGEDREYLEAYRAQASRMGRKYPSLEESQAAFAAHSTLLARYLHDGERGKLRPGIAHLLRAVLAGEVTDQTVRDAFERTHQELDEGFRAWARDFSAGVDPNAVAKWSPAPALRPALAFRAESTDEWLAIAVGAARTGDLEGGVARLLRAYEELPSAQDKERIERERVRLEALIEARDAFLERSAGGKGKLRLTLPQGKLSAGVDELVDGVVVLERNKLELTELLATQIPPSAIVRSMGKRNRGDTPGWLIAYANLISGEDAWDEDLGRAAEDRALEEDGVQLVGLLPTCEAAEALDALARTESATPAEARAWMAMLDALMLNQANHPIVRARSTPLTSAAAEALGVIYDDQQLSEGFKGQVRKLRGGKLELTYDFVHADELEDWRRLSGYLADRRERLFETKADEASSVFKVRGGNLEGIGQATFRHSLEFEAPFEVTYELLYGRPQPGGGNQGHFGLLLGDDAEGTYTIALDVHGGESRNARSGKAQVSFESEAVIKPAVTYKMVARHDGETVTVTRNGDDIEPIKVVSDTTGGGVGLFFHSQITMALKSVKIVGKPRESEDPDRRPWIDAQLGERGLYR